MKIKDEKERRHQLEVIQNMQRQERERERIVEEAASLLEQKQKAALENFRKTLDIKVKLAQNTNRRMDEISQRQQEIE